MNGEASSEVIRLKYAVQLRGERIDGAEDSRPYIGLEHIESGTGHLLSSDKTSEELALAGESLCNVFEPEDVLFGKLRPYLAKTWVANFPGRCTTELLVMTPEDADSNYLKYVFLSHKFLEAVNSSSFGVKMPRADWDSIGNQHIYFPEISSQREISTYLDRETAHLDNLIQAKENMLALLAEKRQALITQAVTRGLDPNVRLKPSGVEWLGDVPEHWEVMRLKLVAEVRGGIAVGKNYYPKEVVAFPYLRVANVQDGDLNLREIKTIDVPEDEAVSYLLEAGDVLMNEGGDADKLGRGAIWDGSISPCLHQNHVFSVRPFGVTSVWLNMWTGSDVAKAYFESRAKQATNLASISSSNLKELFILLPDQQEQLMIVNWIEEQMKRADISREKIADSIALLKERRSALITAAVTGQIDIPQLHVH